MKQRDAGYGDRLNREIEARIEEMERSDYRFPERFSRRDYLVWAAVVVLCLILLAVGARL